MAAWLESVLQWLEAGQSAILVHVATVKGSAPREAGARMLVGDEALIGTIGGGELEYQAIGKARQMLAGNPVPLLQQVALGPELGQCCGGSLTLMFEPFVPADLAWVRKLANAAQGLEPVLRTVRIGESGAMSRDWRIAGQAPQRPVEIAEHGDGLALCELMNDRRPDLFVFGAGHVGRAVVRAVEPLGFAVTWIDGRADAFPVDCPDGIRTWPLAMPELAVEEAGPGAYFLVMTHSHPLDEAICEAVLKRRDFAFLGLIGSATKAARFRKSLVKTGLSEASLKRLTCPIGLPAVSGKDPAVIAASVAADLLIRRQKINNKNARQSGRSGHVRR
jgi:xanthine dehydrogenase accessory factor